MSAIQEERSSVDNIPLAVPVAITPPPSSCSTSPTTSSSNSDSSPTSSTGPAAQASTRTTKSNSTRSRSIAKFKDAESGESTGAIVSTLARPRESRAQSARARTAPCFADDPMAGFQAHKPEKPKSRSSRSRPIPCFDESTGTTPTRSASQSPSKKATKAQSARARPTSCFDDSLLDEAKNAPEEAAPKPKATKTLRSRSIPCFQRLLSSGPTPQPKKEGWKPRAVGTRPASVPSSRMPRSKSSAALAQQASSSSDERSINTKSSARRRGSNPPPRSIATQGKESQETAKQSRGRRRFQWEDEDSTPRTRASSAGDRPMLRAEDLRPRASSDSASSSASSKKKTSSRPRHYEGKFLNRRDQSLLYFSLFPPEKQALRGIVVYLHGMGDHCRRNTALYERYCREGFGVIAYDLLNHGASDYDKYKTRAHISNFNDFVDDTNDFISFAKTSVYKVALQYWRKHHHPRHPHGREKKRDAPPELPLIIAGTSFGSLIGLHTVLSGVHKFHAAVWTAPTIGVTWTPMLWAQWKLARPLVAAFPTAKVIPAVQHSLRSRDPEFLKKYQDDPLTSSDMMTPRSGHQSLHAMMRLQQDERVTDAGSAFCNTPMLFLGGSEDRISDQQAALKFFSTMGNLDKEFKIFDGLYHMIYEEPEKENVLAYLVSWLHKRFPLETRHPNDSHLNVLKKFEPSLRAFNYLKSERTEL